MISDVIRDVRGLGRLWIRAAHTEDKATRQQILREICKDYRAIVDAPGCFFVEDLMEIYPDAKVGISVFHSREGLID
jgi:Sulfotransferase domain